MYPQISLQPNRHQSIKFRHPWIFSGAIAQTPKELKHGELVHVKDNSGNVIGTGTYSAHSSIAIRILDFSKTEIRTAWFIEKIKLADEKRKPFLSKDTTAYRVVFGESDGIPGLVVDRYNNIIVIQVSTAGMEELKPQVLEALTEIFHPQAIVERSDIGIRKEEKLPELVKTYPDNAEIGLVEFQENGFTFKTDVVHGQKTGFFLDQKDLRLRIKDLSKDKTVLNLFSYTGANGVYAMAGGAKSVHNVDSSKPALEICAENAKINNISNFTIEEAEIFNWAEKANTKYDVVIMDPPALIKSKKDREAGYKAYHFLNSQAIKLVNPGGIFITSSCSHFLAEEDLAFILRQASVTAKLSFENMQVIKQSFDHPHSIYFPEGAYLKSFIGIVR